MRGVVSKTRATGGDVGREGRFDAIFDLHHADILRYCMRRLGRIDGEDAAADVFAVAWRRLDQTPSGDATRAWLYGVAYRVVGNQYRARQRRSRLARRLGEVRDGAPTSTDEGFGNADILRALESLRPVDRELLRMAAWDGLSRSEMAQVLGIKENAVDQRLFRARARLKKCLEDIGAKNIESQEASS